MTMRTNYFLLLAILLGMIPMNYTHANDSIPKSVILYTPYTKISVSPGASIDYSIDLINNTDQLTNANLSVSGLSSSWKHEMKSGDRKIRIRQQHRPVDECESFCQRIVLQLETRDEIRWLEP